MTIAQNAGVSGGKRAIPGKRESAILTAPAPTLSTLARQALVEAGNDVATATDILAATLESAEIRRALSLDAVAIAAQSALASVRAYERQAIEQGRQASKVLARAVSLDRTFMAWPLPFGGVLGDATVDDVRKAEGHYRAASASMDRRAAWLGTIAAALPPGRRVRDALTEEQLAKWSAGQ